MVIGVLSLPASLAAPKDALRQGARRSRTEQREVATLADLKIGRKISMRAQQFAELPAKTQQAVANKQQSLTKAVHDAKGDRRHPSDVGPDIRQVKKDLTSRWARAFTFAVDYAAVQQQLEELHAHFKHQDRADTARRIVTEAHRLCRR